MLNLIRNENMKLYRRPRTLLMIGLMIAAVLLLSIMEWYYDESRGGVWQDAVMLKKQHYEMQLQAPNFNEEQKDYFRKQILRLDYHLQHNIHTEEGTMWDGTMSAAEMVVLITLFTVIVAGDSMAGEFSTGTIKLLLIRPARRLKIMASKYIAMIQFGLLLLVLLFVISVLTNGLLYGFEDLDLPLLDFDASGQIVEKNMFATLWQTYLLNGVATIMYVTMAFMISTVFRSSSLAIGFSIFALFASMMLLEVLQPYAWSKYLLLANLDLTQYFHGKPYQEGMTLTFSVMMLLVYYLLFNLTSWLVFTRRDVAA
ncbi:ABC-2 type transport system permease protein [Paenibacillus sp. UNCCL117]|uniref:ABC transporter permease n=1 Tax=unclassified Paenibacillus TaxID=185978 RepID=UPI00088E1337|nr:MULTISPECIES: ABC transporter permease [unclassified Paenibacillus]SDE06632.1 ABC-2 type transport system permease protein [Paenibacillus sp. cl123]SFW59360.1 ABC-2 type transport system permease protein [Paenibacillus sp. UNCCL117]